MKQITIIIILLSCFSTFSFSQNEIKAGIYTEGALFFPKIGNASLENGFGVGGGLYASYPLGKMISTSLSIGYRYKTNDKVSSLPLALYSSGGYGNSGYYQTSEEFPHHFFVIPLKFKFTPEEKLFFEIGIESAWLLNYDVVSEKPEFNWIFGAGYHFNSRFELSLSYMQGFKDQGFGEIIDNEIQMKEVYRNHMLLLNVSCSLFDFKK